MIRRPRRIAPRRRNRLLFSALSGLVTCPAQRRRPAPTIFRCVSTTGGSTAPPRRTATPRSLRSRVVAEEKQPDGTRCATCRADESESADPRLVHEMAPGDVAARGGVPRWRRQGRPRSAATAAAAAAHPGSDVALERYGAGRRTNGGIERGLPGRRPSIRRPGRSMPP